MLLNLNRIGPKVLIEIRQALKFVIDEPDKYIPKKTVEDKHIPTQVNKPIATWAEITQSYFEGEKEKYTYVLLSRFGFRPKKFEEIAKEMGVTRARAQQIQVAVTVRFLKYMKFAGGAQLLMKLHEIMSDHGEDLSLKIFKQKLKKENLIGKFSPTLLPERISKINLFETLICWLNLLSDSRYSQPPVIFPVDIKTLINSESITIKNSKKLQNITPKARRKIKRKVHFTGGINIKEASKILTENEHTTELLLKKFDLKKIDEYWYSLKAYNAENDTSKIPLWTAGMKMLAVKPDINLDIFYDGLRRYANRFYSSIAPNDDFKDLMIELEASRRISGKSKSMTNDSIAKQGNILPGEGNQISEWQKSGQPHGDGHKGKTPPGDGDLLRDGPSLISGESQGSPREGMDSGNKRRSGLFSIEFVNSTPDEDRSAYKKLDHKILINLDHPQIAHALKEGGGGQDSSHFRAIVYEVATVEYAVAIPFERISAGEKIEATDALFDVRYTIDRITRRFSSIL